MSHPTPKFFGILTSNTLSGRMSRSVFANIFDKGALTIVQLLTIPILTQIWGADGYGIWLMLMTIPIYIGLSDFGFGAAAGVALTQAVAHRTYDKATTILQSTLVFVLGTVSIAVFLAVGFALWVYSQDVSGGPFTAGTLAIAIVFVSGYAMLLALMSILTVAYRATHKYAYAMTFSGALILIEGTALVVSVYSGIQLAAITAIYFLVRLTGCLVFARILVQKEPWARVGFGSAQRQIIKDLAHPSLAALALTFATAILLQGMTITLGITAGAAIVAVFGASRMISRVPLQIAGVVMRPSIPELTRAITTGNSAVEKRLIGLNIAIASGVAIPFGVVLVFAGPRILEWLTNGALMAPTVLFLVLALATMFHAIWTAIATSLIAMNRQSEFSILYLGFSILAVLSILSFNLGSPISAALAMAVVEALLLARIVQIYFADRKGARL